MLEEIHPEATEIRKRLSVEPTRDGSDSDMSMGTEDEENLEEVLREIYD